MPGLFDLPRDKLLSYTGTNPRPADFDLYWDAALAESRAAPLNAVFEPNPTLSIRAAECFDLWFAGADGARLHAKFVRPRHRPAPGPALILFHGYSDSSRDWLHMIPWVAEGFCVAWFDCRGQGGLSQDPGGQLGGTLNGHIIRGAEDPDPRKLYYRQTFLDTERLARVLAALPEVDSGRLVCSGFSQGGGLSLACAALSPLIRRCASVYPFLCDYQRVYELDLAKDAYEELARHFLRHDPRHEREREFFLRLGYIDVQHLAPRIRADTLMITCLQDTICPPSTQFAAYNKITAPKRVVFYPDHGHYPMNGGEDLLFNHLGSI